MTERLSVCFVWHMHQPLYKDRLSGLYLMPWARLHGIKDYLDMPLILEDFPNIKQTFNLVPSLLEQLEDYANNGAVDEQLRLTEKDSDAYTEADKASILAESFHCNLDRQIKVHPTYFHLWQKRDRFLRSGTKIAQILEEFTAQEYADMTAWLNLAWFDPYWVEKNPEIAAFINQGCNFTIKQRKRIIEIEREILRQTIPVYKRLMKQGNIEVTTSPYYHPILPLLIDTNAARLADPYTSLPHKIYLHRDDARIQLEKGIALYERFFGCRPKGMWPSEMAVSPPALELIAQAGIKWVVLDEALLTRTIDSQIRRDQNRNLTHPEVLCQPYKLTVGDQEITVLFREVVASNEIGFSYGSQDPEEAASALYLRLKHIQQKLFHWPREGIVTIALDGENCWETYQQDGKPFLNELYERISKDPTLRVTTVSEYLENNPADTQLFNIQSGSWINADFHIWIGDPVKNRAWDLLGDTRKFLVNHLVKKTVKAQVVAQAWEEIYAAEGSDWFWWFGEPNNSAQDHVFDEQFRLRLQNVYKLMGMEPPSELMTPVEEQVEHKKKTINGIGTLPS